MPIVRIPLTVFELYMRKMKDRRKKEEEERKGGM